jgi:ribosomal-protein-alanine N-acetyltransferase
LLGSCGLDVISEHEASLGYGVAPAYWGRGYVTEAARALVAAGFRELRLHRVTATCQPENTGSARVLEKLGMTREGHLRRHVWQRDRWRDSYLYAVLEDEWPAGSPA